MHNECSIDIASSFEQLVHIYLAEYKYKRFSQNRHIFQTNGTCCTRIYFPFLGGYDRGIRNRLAIS